MLIVINDAGRHFRVRAIRKGERYGLNNCLTHDADEMLVELTDATDGPGPTGNGGFVVRYLATTFLARDNGDDLWLFGKDMAWRLAPAQVREIRAWLLAGCPE